MFQKFSSFALVVLLLLEFLRRMLEFVGFMWSSSICLALRCWIDVMMNCSGV